jgi:uncharacterized protein (TIGR03435 family)
MPEMDDIASLREYAETGSGAAFAAIVERHVNLVYSTALRSAGNPHAAEEITQAVFVILAKKARKLSRRIVLSGWLYHAARLTAANYLRTEIRRQRREQEACMQTLLNEPEPEVWPQIAPLLDAALERLGEKDRNAIVLRFFENKNLRDVGLALGASEDAAKMRVSRALERLREFFVKRGIHSTAGDLAGTISTHSIQAAPLALAKTVSAVALAKGAAATTSTLTLVKGVLKIMAWTKAKTAIAVGAGILLAAGTTTVTVKEIQAHRTYPWQVQYFDSRVLDRAPPQVAIVPARFSSFSSSGGSGDANNKMMGLGISITNILGYAYGQSPARTIFPDNLSPDKYDFIANLPSGNEAALQKEIKNKFGLAGKRETRETDVLLLKIQNSHAPELKPADPRRLDRHTTSSSRSGAGYCSFRNQTLSGLARCLEGRFEIPVIDRTGLNNHFDIDLKWDETDWQHPNLDGLKQALLDQLGLELVPSHEPVEMLVVEKAM